MRNEEINAEKDLAVEDTAYAVAKFNLMTSSRLGDSKTQGWGQVRGRCWALSIFLKSAFLGLGLGRRVRVSVNHNPNANPKITFFKKKKRDPDPDPGFVFY